MLIILGIAICVLFWWLDKSQKEYEDREDKAFGESIKHLPEDKQVELWATHLRNRNV